MTFKSTKDRFLNNRTDGDYYDSSLENYKRKLEVFFEFLSNEYSVNDKNYKEILRGIDERAITKSIEFYVDKYSVLFRSTIDLYISVINSYFSYLNNHTDIKNNNFDSSSQHEKIMKSVIMKVKELGLEAAEEKSPITKDAYIKILKKCDDILNSYGLQDMLDNKTKRNNNPISRFNSAIVTKLVMLTGIKNRVIDTIKLNDYNQELNLITINNFSIHLPNGLGKQMKTYLELRNIIVKDSAEDYQLFIKRDGTRIATSYDSAFRVVRETLGNTSVESVAKYTIMQMIRKGMNFSLIIKLTSFSANSILHCQEEVNLEKINEDIHSQTRYIDSKIRSMDIFDLL